MQLWELFVIAVGLSADAFAVAICKGLSFKKLSIKNCTTIGIYFGLFQGIMPLIGFILGISFQEIITQIDHWIAFILLSIIGLNMIKDSLSKEQEKLNQKINFKVMFPLALATSIDALAVGITFAFLKVNIYLAISIISITTFFISITGVIIGNKVGNKLEKKAELLGGLILIMIGLKILLEHLNII